MDELNTYFDQRDADEYYYRHIKGTDFAKLDCLCCTHVVRLNNGTPAAIMYLEHDFDDTCPYHGLPQYLYKNRKATEKYKAAIEQAYQSDTTIQIDCKEWTGKTKIVRVEDNGFYIDGLSTKILFNEVLYAGYGIK